MRRTLPKTGHISGEHVILTADCGNDDLTMYGEDRALRQIVLNLLSNALNSTPAGGSVRVSARRAGGRIEICVADSGVGIAAEKMPFLFEPFQTASEPLEGTGGGIGLGLPIVKSLVDRHGGRIDIETAPNAGTRVTVTLPVEGEAPA